MPDRMIVVLSPKGGSGKTTVATNLAVGLARRRPGEVLLVDLDLAFGDVAAALLLDPRPGLFEVAGGGVAPRVHRGSGLHVVGAPDPAGPAALPPPSALVAALAEVARRYTTVVVDTGAGFDGAAQAAATGPATDLVLVASMDVPTLLGLRKVLAWLDDLGVGAERHLVLNRADSAVGLDEHDVVASVGLPVAVAIPSSAAITRSVNEGAPLTGVEGAEGPAVDAFRALVARLAPLRSPWRVGRWRR